MNKFSPKENRQYHATITSEKQRTPKKGEEENEMKLKKVFACMMAATMLFGLTACGGSEGKKESGKNDTKQEAKDDTLTIWAWDEAFNIKAANVAKEMYAEKNPDAEIEIVTMAQDDIVTKLNTSLSSGSYDGLPEIVLIEDYKAQGYLTSYQDEFADLSDIVSEDAFAEYKMAVNKADGKIYSVPFDSGVAATFYRKDLIEQAGYTEADMANITWDKYIEIGKAVKEVKQGKIDFKVDKFGIVHTSIGKVNFEAEKIMDNAREFMATIQKLKPSSAKGTYVKSVFLSSTMSPGIKLDLKSLLD